MSRRSNGSPAATRGWHRHPASEGFSGDLAAADDCGSLLGLGAEEHLPQLRHAGVLVVHQLGEVSVSVSHRFEHAGVLRAQFLLGVLQSFFQLIHLDLGNPDGVCLDMRIPVTAADEK